jgi:hypothetical protein
MDEIEARFTGGVGEPFFYLAPHRPRRGCSGRPGILYIPASGAGIGAGDSHQRDSQKASQVVS